MSRKAEAFAEVRDRLMARIAETVPGVDAALVRAGVGEQPRGWRALDGYLGAHPDALTRPDHDVPAVLVRLAHALVAAGYSDVRLPRCARCDQPKVGLERRDEAGRRICGTCAAALRVGTCARCGQIRRLEARRDDGVICTACYEKDSHMARECGGCGQTRRTVARAADGSPRCQACHPRPVRICASCGDQRPANAMTADGPVCTSCYRAPDRACGRCGRRRPIARRAHGDIPDLCYGCYQGQETTCSICTRVRPCQRVGSGRPTCKTCRPRPPRPCFRCGRSRPVQAEWPAGPVCVGCYENVRRHPAECRNCRQVRPLIGRDDNGAAICGPCAGVGLTYTCRDCGRSGEIHCDQRCFRCVLTERITDLLTGTDGRVAEQFHPLLQRVSRIDNPATVVGWLAKSRSARLLRELAASGEPISHDLLDQQPQTQALHYIREVLVTTGILPTRDEHLERLGPWLDRVLADAPSHHIRTVKPFAQWYVLRRARRTATRNGGYRRGSADYARAKILAALDLLAWLDQHALTLDLLTQPALDQWLEDTTTTRRAVRYFLAWAHDRGLATKLHVPLAARTAPVVLLDDDDRMAQLRRCLTDETLGLDLRVAGALILLFALPLTRVLQLRDVHVVLDANHTYLSIDGHRLLLPPRLADLIHRLQTRIGARSTLARLDRAPGWLFPAQIATRPAHDNAFAARLQHAGINSFAGRNAARLALATELPASVLADLTGLHVTTAMRWTTWAKRDWAQFVAARAGDRSEEPLQALRPRQIGKKV